MPRVLFVHHRPQASGSARSLALLVEALSSEWDIHVMAPDGASARLFELSGATVHRGPVPAFTHTWDVQYRGLRWLVAAREALWAPGHIRRLRRTLRELRPDLVHVNDVVMPVSAHTAARAGFPVVWHLRSSAPHKGLDRRSRLVASLVDRYAAATIAIDDDVARSYRLRVPPTVVPNPVAVHDAPPADLGVPAGRTSIGFFGYLRRQKGWPEYLQALRLLIDRGAPVHGVVVGGAVRPAHAYGGLRGRILRAAGVPNEEGAFARTLDWLELRDHVSWLPFVDDTAPILQALDIVVFPNQGVGLGRPVLEASSHGKAVVAAGSFTGGGVVVPGETMILLAEPTPEALADAVGTLVDDPAAARALGERARDMARATLTPTVVSAAVESVYQRVLLG